MNGKWVVNMGTTISLLICVSFAVSLTTAFFIVERGGAQGPESGALFGLVSRHGNTSQVLEMYTAIGLVAINEELAFTIVPLLAVMLVYWPKKPGYVYLTAIGATTIFGYLHGSWQLIFVQGLSHLLYYACFIELSAKNWDNPHRKFQGIVSAALVCIIAHFLYDTMIFAILRLL